MISIIVCSINFKLFSDLKENIEKTIGVPYEMIYINNYGKKVGLCENYNNAIKKVLFETICFVHEDIKFHTPNWGNKLLDIFSNPEIGLVGVSGSVYKSQFPSAWTACVSDFYRINTLQHYPKNDTPELHHYNPEKTTYSKVVVLDGVFLATKKNILTKHNFDELTFKGFHGYDLDLSLKIGQEYKVVVNNEILLEHFSSGTYDRVWLSDMITLHKKWKKYLPIGIDKFSTKNRVSDYIALSSYLNHLIKLKFPKNSILWNYILIITKYYDLNKFKFTRTVFSYLLLNNP